MASLKIQRVCCAISIVLAFIMTGSASALVAISGWMPVFWIYIAAVLLSITIVPGFKGRENCSLFALLAVTVIPANLRAVLMALHADVVTVIVQGKTVISVMVGIMFYALLFSLEQIIFGVIVRTVWPRQEYYKETAE